MASLPTDRTTADTPAEHVADHNTLHATHNLIDTVGDEDDVLTVVDGAPAWAPAQSGTSVGVLKDYAFARRTAGNLNFSEVTKTAVDTGTDLVLTAASGDTIEIDVQAMVGGTSQTNDYIIDVATIVSAAVVNWASGSASGTGFGGMPGTYRPTGSEVKARHGKAFYTLQAGDISGGTVTLRLYHVTSGATPDVTLWGSTTYPLLFAAKNIGPAL